MSLKVIGLSYELYSRNTSELLGLLSDRSAPCKTEALLVRRHYLDRHAATTLLLLGVGFEVDFHKFASAVPVNGREKPCFFQLPIVTIG